MGLLYNCYHKRRDQDLSDELVSDMLQDAGVIEDDKLIKFKILNWELDADYPRCYIALIDLSDIYTETVKFISSIENGAFELGETN